VTTPQPAGLRKALVKVGYACNEHCSFCHTQDLREIQGDSEEIEAKIDRAAALHHDMVVLSGGEATIRPELFSWAERIAAHGMDLGLVTNGLVLAYPGVLDRLLGLRLRYVYMSLHGAEARVHNRLVRADSHAAALAALENLRGRGLDLTINCVVTRHNVDHLIALVDRALDLPEATLKFSCVEPKGGAHHLHDQLVPPVSEAARKVAAAIVHGRARASQEGPRFTHGGFPLCLLPGLEDAFDDLRTHRFRTMIEVGEPDFFPVDDANKVQPEGSCDGCRLRGPCPGLYTGYFDRHGTSELRAVTEGPRSNAFDWTFERTIAAPEGGGCPLLRDGTTPWDRGRDLFVVHEGRFAHYHADARDFSGDEIAAIKHERGQVYLDASRKPAPDDFPRDLVPLRRSSMCEGCPRRDGCTGMFEAVMDDLFTRDDAEVREIVAGLSGDVLDVGCGEGPYDDLLGPLVRRGDVRYLGLEPDRIAAERVDLRRGWGEIRVGPLETFEANAAFDHVLVLRSWNHLHDPDRALDRVVAALRPGGTLTVVDNVAFGLARSPVQTARARASHAAFEHHRNDDAEAAARRLVARGLEPLLRRDVGPATSNQWLLRLARASC
jgi:MoaA/NifB/PqqE/SkfB family radical SAM enzyme/SAM-dependent methyltransferase